VERYPGNGFYSEHCFLCARSVQFCECPPCPLCDMVAHPGCGSSLWVLVTRSVPDPELQLLQTALWDIGISSRRSGFAFRPCLLEVPFLHVDRARELLVSRGLPVDLSPRFSD